ncbi:MAG: SAM-dependent methyltransferase [Sphingomonas echinoides]|jgi:SAM-dependent methyltransferase
MGSAFARAYEKTATRIMGPISFAALERVGSVGRGVRVLDIGAGTGALSMPAAYSGAAVMAIDIAPGMVELLSDRLAPFPDATARIMDGQALTFNDGEFDAAFSIAGVSIFQDWRRSLSEQVRVLRSGGKAALATWRTMPGGGPFVIMAQAMRAVFPDRLPPHAPDGFLTLSEPARMAKAMEDAGLLNVEVDVIEAEWTGPAGTAYLDELRDLHSYMPAYAALDAHGRDRVDEAILATIDRQAIDGRVVMKTAVVLGIGTKA